MCHGRVDVACEDWRRGSLPSCKGSSFGSKISTARTTNSFTNNREQEIIQACLITPTIQQVTASHCKSTSRSFGSTWFPPATALCRAGFRDRPLSPTSVPPRAPSVAWRRGVLRSGRQTTDDSTAHGIDFRCLKKGAREPSKDLISEVIYATICNLTCGS